MKVYTKTVWQWVGDQLKLIEAEAYEHTGPVDLLKGGSSGGPYYGGLEKLYDEQAKSAEFLSGIFRNTVAPGYQDWGKQIKGYGSIANQEQQAQRATTDVVASQAGQQAALEENMASLGIDPSDPRYASTMAQTAIQNAGQQAAAGTGAREQVRRQDIAQQQDWVGMGMGTPTTAAQASNAAGNALNSANANQLAYNSQQAKGVGALAQLGTNMYGLYDQGGGTSMAYKDGGPVLRLKHGGYVNRLAAQKFAGGGFARVTPITPPPPMLPRTPSTGEAVGRQATTPMGINVLRRGGGKGLEWVGKQVGSEGLEQFGHGLSVGPKQIAIESARAQIDAALAANPGGSVMGGGTAASAFPSALPGAAPAAAATPVAGMGGGTASLFAPAAAAGETAAGIGTTGLGAAGAADAALAAGATEAVAGTAGAAGLGGMGAAGAALGAAMPWVGAGLAAYAIGSQAGWWKDGGPVGKQGLSRGGDDGAVGPGSVQDTGEVDGPGGPKDDMINAQLSDGEYVFPKGAVMFFGLDKLDKMRQKGLEYEKQMGIA